MAGSLTNAVEIEVDTLNDHKCMATLISLIQFLNDNGIINKASQDSQVSVGILSDTLVLFDCCCHGSRSNARKSVVLQINCQISSSILICFIFLFKCLLSAVFKSTLSSIGSSNSKKAIGSQAL